MQRGNYDSAKGELGQCKGGIMTVQRGNYDSAKGEFCFWKVEISLRFIVTSVPFRSRLACQEKQNIVRITKKIFVKIIDEILF